MDSERTPEPDRMRCGHQVGGEGLFLCRRGVEIPTDFRVANDSSTRRLIKHSTVGADRIVSRVGIPHFIRRSSTGGARVGAGEASGGGVVLAGAEVEELACGVCVLAGVAERVLGCGGVDLDDVAGGAVGLVGVRPLGGAAC
jgi:hypothetical protein